MVGFQYCALVGAQPFGIGEAVAQQENRQATEQHGRNPLQQEHPLPACQAALACREMAENPSGKRPAEQAGHRNGRHEQRHDATTAEGREPLREVQHHAGEEARFGGAGEQAQAVELGRRGDEHQAGREQAPGDHHHRNPAPWTEAGQGQVARHAAQHIAYKENTGAQAVYGFAELECVEHLQLGKSNVNPVEVVEQVADEDKGDQTQGDALVDGVFVVIADQRRVGAL